MQKKTTAKLASNFCPKFLSNGEVAGFQAVPYTNQKENALQNILDATSAGDLKQTLLGQCTESMNETLKTDLGKTGTKMHY